MSIVSAGPEAGALPVRIVLVLPADPERMTIGGIASFVRGFVKFAPPDFEISLVGISATRSPGAWTVAELEGRRISFLPVSRGRAERRSRVPLALRFVAGLVRHRRRIARRGHILSFHRPATDLAFLGDSAPRWRVVHLSVTDLTTAGSESRWRSLPRALARVERASFRRMDRIYVVNQAVADEYRSSFPDLAARITYLPNWADGSIFRPPSAAERAEARAEVASELGVSADGPLLLYAGRLEGQKHPELLAATFAAVRSRHTGAVLLVAGEGTRARPMREQLVRAGVADGVRFLGTQPRERLARLMHASHVLLITSRYETGPTVGFEALASGLPIAMTHVGQVARLVREHGAGRTVDDHDPLALADAVDAILAEPAERLAEAARVAVEPYLAERVLAPVYEDNRAMAASFGRPGVER